jgi:predicted Na+-dependent transporter
MMNNKTEMEGTTPMINKQSIQRREKYSNRFSTVRICILALVIFLIPLSSSATEVSGAATQSGEQIFHQLSTIARGEGDAGLFNQLNTKSRKLDWTVAAETEFVGNLRILTPGTDKTQTIYLLRKLTGEVYILSLPDNPAMLEEHANSFYAGLDKKYENKLNIKATTTTGVIDGRTYAFARFTETPQPVLLDKIFKICIILMLFFVMVGMGMTLTFKDFALVFTKPRGIIIGEILQFGLMPFLAFCMGHLLGFYDQYPYIFVGMILITAIPGGVTSNIMTYYAKGDLALSISLTSFSTVFSIVFTPLLLALYCANMPEVVIPVKLVVQTILILVIVPLIIGMTVRTRWTGFAQKATPFFSALGVIALLVLIIAGILSNLHVFADTARYGLKFYLTVFSLTFIGMLSGIGFSKLFGINNFQTRAISLETGLRNAALAMTIALLIQDTMGDFYSSMFVTSGLFGLVMYLAGVISIVIYKPLLPVPVKTD